MAYKPLTLKIVIIKQNLRDLIPCKIQWPAPLLRIKLIFGKQINMVLTNIAAHHFAKKRSILYKIGTSIVAPSQKPSPQTDAEAYSLAPLGKILT